ncbi:MAG: NADH:flavin oxidoreductase/NADH oxidase, partial [Pseudomonadota bacterium]
RVEAAGFNVIEVYAAHGFLLHQFYSPLSNTRADEWGGDFEGRTRLCVEVARAIRANWPASKPLFFRISATDWLEGGWTIEDSVALAAKLQAQGIDVIDCSSGGLGGPHPPIKFPLGPAFQAELAANVRKNADIMTMAVGFIWQAAIAEQVLKEGQADLVALGRELLYNPNWTLQAAQELTVDSAFALWKPAFGWWLNKRERVMRKLGLRAG